MEKYHKIQSVYKRDRENNFKTLLEGQYSLPEFEFLANNQWIFTEKVDGTNIRIMFDGEKIEFRGKTDNAMIPGPLNNRLIDGIIPRLANFQDIFNDAEGGVCFYGEGYGPRIQKGGGNYNLHQDFVLFDVKIAGWWLQRKDVEWMANEFGLDIVPIIGQGTLNDMVEQTREGFNSIWGDFKAEGIVARPATELKTRSGHRIITKIKYKDFLV